MLLPTYCQNVEICVWRSDRLVNTRPPLAETSGPVVGYRLIILDTTSGFDKSYELLTRCVSESVIAFRWDSETGCGASGPQAN